MESLEEYIGCIAFVDWDYHKVKIERIEDGKLIGRCCHGDEFLIDEDTPIYKQIR